MTLSFDFVVAFAKNIGKSISSFEVRTKVWCVFSRKIISQFTLIKVWNARWIVSFWHGKNHRNNFTSHSRSIHNIILLLNWSRWKTLTKYFFKQNAASQHQASVWTKYYVDRFVFSWFTTTRKRKCGHQTGIRPIGMLTCNPNMSWGSVRYRCTVWMHRILVKQKYNEHFLIGSFENLASSPIDKSLHSMQNSMSFMYNQKVSYFTTCLCLGYNLDV